MSAALKPCPFCADGHVMQFAEESTVVCLGCGAQTPAPEIWNKREPDWERRWMDLVETTGRRIAESVVEEENG